MKLSTCIHQFFVQYLPRIKGSSVQTIKAYRDTFTLFVPFAAQHLSVNIASLRMDHLTPDLILAFLDHLESGRKNTARTRNLRLATLKSLAKMIRFMYPQHRQLADRIINIPQKRTQKQLIGFLYPDEILRTFDAVDLKKKQGVRDYTLLHLLDDSGARASEAAMLSLDYLDPQQETLAILGKANRYRQIKLRPKTVQLMELYIKKYRVNPKPVCRHYLFINQRGEGLTRHGIYRICRKYLSMALPAKRLKQINPAHSFRHSCAVRMLLSGASLSKIKNHLGHENVESTMVYLHMDLSRRRYIQKKFLEHTQSVLAQDPRIDELIDWQNREDIMTWLDSL
jgi:site-specific recombinase XerD